MNDLMQRGGPLMWPLLACSLLALTVCIERLLWGWRYRRRLDRAACEQIIALVRAGRIDRARAASRNHRCPAATVLAEGLAAGPAAMDQAMTLAAGELIEQMKRGLGLLDTIVTVAPLLGILGTVTGIIQSFDLLGEAHLQDPRLVLGGVAQALVTTAAGLVVAVLALLPLNYFTARVNRQADFIAAVATRLELAIQAPAEAHDAT